MLYINSNDIEKIGIDWKETVNVIKNSVLSLNEGSYNQPIKPYLRYNNKNNRIIAMPAYLGGMTNMSGIKWIASFPSNTEIGLQRAHSVTILNDSETGKPLSIFNTAMISGIRTASVSGLMIDLYDKSRTLKNVKVGIIGFGPIGQLHLQMITSLLGEKISKIIIFDIKEISIDLISKYKDKLQVASSWEEAYNNADILVTCTVSSNRYINTKPKDNSLILNVSLRDFCSDIINFTSTIIVDDWEEVCRENTDIEMLHKKKNLQKKDTHSIIDVVCNNLFEKLSLKEPIFFNPMGMAVFDIAMATFFYRKALSKKIGTTLE
ncbi:2,3-diaminopropionate biosynthesis protein SbnB [Lysinibacillus xylanilyticus]|uniref:2,3-diaminopropionate biosynthesis protein SbnB n=1 Tax=Lysinibacillus xylanilyticus TaxID=582475 RepID=UPI003821F197